MSKSHRGKRHHDRRPEPVAEISESKSGIVKVLLFCLIAVVLAGVPFGLGKYFEFNSPGAFDSGSYVYSAKHILDGAEIGVDEKPSAQLGTLLVNMLGVRMFGFNETGPKLLQGIFQAVALIMMFVTMWKLFDKLPALVGVVVASVYLSSPIIAKFGNVKEQFMIAFMIIGVCFFILYHLKSCKYCAMLAGAFLIWAPLFKPTGLSAVGAVGVFVILQPILKHKTWRQMGMDILWLFVGAGVAIALVFIWMIGWHIKMALPYQYLWDVVAKQFSSPAQQAGEAAPDYLASSRKMISFSELSGRVLRYYGVLILPVVMAIGALVAKIVRTIIPIATSRKSQLKPYDQFVILLGVWWILDMAFVWVSPRSYEQYYLPLNASAAMLGGYIVALYSDKITEAQNKAKWVGIGVLSLLVMFILSMHIFIGINKSPHSGNQYKDNNGNPIRTRGYVQKYREVQLRLNKNYIGPWEQVGQYIRSNSNENDGIYVWGWFPGIYVTAQRLSPAPKAFEGTMHTLTPGQLSERVDEILNGFNKQSPKFIVDTYKVHFPWDRPPLELWPSVRNAFQLLLYVGGLPKDRIQQQRVIMQTFHIQPNDLDQSGFIRAESTMAVAQFETAYKEKLTVKWPDEAQRYDAMKPFRDYVMKNYRIVGAFGQHVLFQHK